MEQRSRSEKRELIFVLLCLLVCVAVTGVLLADRLSGLAADENDIIALVPSEETTASERALTGESSTARTGAVSVAAASGQENAISGSGRGAESGAQVEDDSQVWTTDTEIELFRVQYENDQKAVSVSGSDGHKVIAPGTENDYTFWLKNPAGMTADYVMEVEAYVTPGEVKLPVKARMKSYEGNYLVGSEDDWEDVPALNGVSDQATLGANRYASYTIEWQWPFESEDENGDLTEADGYDTMLGNLEMNEDLTLTVVIRTTASLTSDDETGGHGLLPKTGDTTRIMLYILLLAGAGIVIILIIMKKRRKPGILRRLLLIMVSLILGVNVYLWNARSLGGNSLPMPFGFGVAVVLSGSMEPELSVNDLILVRETKDVRKGDIIVYQSEYELIVHRVIRIDGETIQTQGDANNVADSPIEMSAVKGKMIGHIPWVGQIVRGLKTPVGIILILAAAFGLMEWSYRREKEQDDKELEQIKEEIRRLKEEQKS